VKIAKAGGLLVAQKARDTHRHAIASELINLLR
jgi:hypothetical protein